MRISDWSSDVCSSDLPENRNEAARFVTLIDALYEYKVKLLASAAAEPDRLYVAGDGAFEFERTASRLAEMQSDDYLALRSEEHTSELQSLMRISYAVFCLKKKKKTNKYKNTQRSS